MSTALAIPDSGRHLTCCCYRHWRGWCEPRQPACCGECPSEFAPGQRFPTPWALEQVAEGRRWHSEFWGERQALVEIAAALEWWDRYDFRSTTVLPQMAQVVRTVRRVREALWSAVPF